MAQQEINHYTNTFELPGTARRSRTEEADTFAPSESWEIRDSYEASQVQEQIFYTPKMFGQLFRPQAASPVAARAIEDFAPRTPMFGPATFGVPVAEAPTTQDYLVRPGDTLFAALRSAGYSAQEIRGGDLLQSVAQLNNLENPMNVLPVGKTIQLPVKVG